MRWTDIQVFLGAGMIVPSTSSFSHPIVCVTKKDSSIRLCVDYNYLNSGTVPDYYPMPNMDEFIYEIIPVKSTDFGGSLPIFFTFFTFLPANLPIYHNLPISTDFFRGSTEF